MDAQRLSTAPRGARVATQRADRWCTRGRTRAAGAALPQTPTGPGALTVGGTQVAFTPEAPAVRPRNGPVSAESPSPPRFWRPRSRPDPRRDLGWSAR